MMAASFRQGEIYWGNLDPTKGSEQGGTRPILILQVDRVTRAGNTVVVIPLTTTISYARLPTCVLIPKGTASLPADSVAPCHQIRVVDKAGIHDYIGSIPPTLMAQIDDTVRRTLGL